MNGTNESSMGAAEQEQPANLNISNFFADDSVNAFIEGRIVYLNCNGDIYLVSYGNGTEQQQQEEQEQFVPVNDQNQINNESSYLYYNPTPTAITIREESQPMEMDIHQEPIQNNNNDTTAVAQQGMYIDIPVNIEIEDTKLQQQPQDLGTVEEPPVEPFTRERFITCREAVCVHCGTRTRDLHYCEYCKTRISNDAKLVDVPNSNSGNMESQQQIVKKTPTRRPRGKKANECIVLSSDDEDHPKAKISKQDSKTDSSSSSEFSTGSVSGGGKNKLKVNLSPSPNHLSSNTQRPTYLLHDDETINFPLLINEIKESASMQLSVKVECRSIRVGDYKCCTPLSSGEEVYTVVFSDKGVMFTLPHSQNKQQLVTCAVPIDTILIVEAHYKKSLPVIFLATGLRLAKGIRKLLGMSDDPKAIGNHYGPQDGDKCQKRIVFLLTNINDQAAGTISKIFGRTHSEIDHQRANAILCDITREPHITTAAAPRKLVIGTSKLPEHGASKRVVNQNSAANSSTDVQLPSSHIDVSQNKTLLSYAEIPICQQDLLCLADEQFLNDSIIDFWLRYFEIEILSTADKEKTYMFSTFFYKRLTTKPKKRPSISNNTPEEDSNLTPAEKRHNRVKRWTKNVDIFEKDFLIIPICENLHWFLAVICFPGLIGVHDITTGEPLPEYKLKKKVSTKSNKTGINTGTAPATNGFIDDIVGDTSIDQSTCSQFSEESTASQLQNDSSVLMNESSSNAVDVKVKQPCILVFDSLVGETRSRVYSTLREYLKMEYKTRKLKQPVAEGASQQPVIVEREFTKTSMPASMPSVPQQPNHCDCGIYTLFYVECFFKYRIQTFDMSSEACKHWLNFTCDSKREEIYMCIQALVKKMNPEAVPLIPRLTFNPIPPTPAKTITNQQLVTESNTVAEDTSTSTTNTTFISEFPTINLKPSTVESTRASLEDNDHDHDYAGVPNRLSTPTNCSSIQCNNATTSKSNQKNELNKSI